MPRRPSAFGPSASVRAVLLLTAACVFPCSPAPAAGLPAVPDPAPCTAALSLSQVLDRVRNGPRSRAAGEEAAAMDGLVRQAGVRPNPEIAVEVEDFTGSGSYTELGQTQTTVSFAQRIPLGGLRARRANLAEHQGLAEIARTAEDSLEAAVTAKRRFIDALAGRERVRIASDGERLAAEVVAAARRRAAAGAGSAADEERARIALARAALLVLQARREEKAAARELASLWGGAPDDEACVTGAWPVAVATTLDVPDRAVLPSLAVRTADAEVDAGRAAVELAKASAAPDLEVGAGLRHLAGPGEVSAVAAVRIEVPIFDRNDGAIDAAEKKLLAAQSRARAVRSEAARHRGRLAEAIAAAAAEADLVEHAMLPAAQRAWTSLSQAWQHGAASVLEVLDARRSLVDLRLQRLDALRDGLVATADLEGWSGRVNATLALAASAPAADRTTE